MAADEPPGDGPSLAPPSLGFGRRRRKQPVVQAEPAPPPVVGSEPEPEPEPTETFVPTPRPAEPAEPAETPPTPREPRPPRTPPTWFAGRYAAIAAGLVVGLFVFAATAVSLRVCEAVRGTPSCGGAGFFLLVAILLVGVLLGAALLRLGAVPDPGSTSLLAVGLMAVVALLVLVGVIFSWWMVVVVPLVCVGTFALSHWVTTSFSNTAED